MGLRTTKMEEDDIRMLLFADPELDFWEQRRWPLPSWCRACQAEYDLAVDLVRKAAREAQRPGGNAVLVFPT
jgi:hypothetical protein